MHEIRFAIRSLLKTPIVTTIAVLSVALGIGANVAIFSIFNQTLLRPLPVQEPDRLVNLVSPGPRNGSVFVRPVWQLRCGVQLSDVPRSRGGQTSFTGIAAHRDFGANIAYAGSSEGGDGKFVSGSYFPVLGLTPETGRLLGPNDEREQGAATSSS